MVDVSNVPADILGLPLPDALRSVIAAGRWRPPARQVLADVFGDDPEWPSFFEPQSIERETRHLRDDPHDVMDMFKGTPPRDIDPQLCLFIGVLYADAPFALDYRHGFARPRVVYFGAATYLFGESGNDLVWKQITPDIVTLIKRLGLWTAH
jgi:hypothetical protein